MDRINTTITRRRVTLLVGLMLAIVFCLEYLFSAEPVASIGPQRTVVLAGETGSADPFETLIRHDPLAAMIEARAQHLRDVIDYECVMVKQELLPAGMSAEQEISVKFRQAPYSVYMEWKRNPGMAARVIYVKGRWTDSTAQDPEDRELAVAQPGALARIFVKSVTQPIHGRLAKKSSRRFIDEFGFEKTLDRLINICEMGKSRGELGLEYSGESQFDGRAVWVIRRHLPYIAEGGRYPDRTAEILIDQRLRVPVAVYCYSDDDRNPTNLLAKYEYRRVRMGVGLTEKDFEPVTYGM